MTRMRKSPTILKPMIDDTVALQFASAGSPSPAVPMKPSSPAPAKKAAPASGKNVRQVSFTLKKELYERIAKEAARKNRTVEEHLVRHLTKRYGK
jgi:hypothetical protein